MILKQQINKRRLLQTFVALVLISLAATLYFIHSIDLKDLHHRIAAYPGLVVFFLVAILPIFGFSIAIIYLVVGVKFGASWGMAVIALATAAHLLGSHWMAKSFLRKRLEAFIARKKYRLPEIPAGENASVSLMTAIIPGLPYFARNYLLALAGVPLKTYFWICLPVYVIRSFVTVSLAAFSKEFTTKKIIFIVVILLIKLAICAWVIQRLRNKQKRKRARDS